MINILIEITFVIVILCLLTKALFETAWGIILVITGLFLMALGYSCKMIASLIKIVESLTLFLSPAKRRRIQAINATRTLGRACLRRTPTN